MNTVEVVITFEYRKISEDGTALTGWTDFFTKSYSAATRDPIRHTIEKIIPEGNGRYEFKIKRNTAKSTDTLITDTLFFESIRAFGPVHPDYGDVTLIELSLLATDQINNNASTQISVVCNRKLYPVTATGFGVIKVAARPHSLYIKYNFYLFSLGHRFTQKTISSHYQIISSVN